MDRPVAAVSVVIPCYRSAKTIGRAVRSVASQTVLPKEIIIVDDCSGDGTVDEIEQVISDYPSGWVRLIALPVNGGPSKARNEGWSVASQRYIAFLDADDSWHPQKIEIQYGWMIRNPQISLTGHNCKAVSSDDKIDREMDLAAVKFSRVTKRQIVTSNRFSTPSIMVKKDIPYRFRTAMRYCEDYMLWSELIWSGALCYKSEVDLAYLFKPEYGAGGLSGNLKAMEKGELEVYDMLADRRLIPVFLCQILKAYSFAKYLRRVALVRVRLK